jgi:hypothetical protein
MPAQRWQSGIHEFFQTIGETDEELMNTFMTSVFSRFPKKEDAPSDPQEGGKDNGPKFPDVLPILPLRGVVVYPNTAVPLTVGQPRSIKLVDDVVGGDKYSSVLLPHWTRRRKHPAPTSCIGSARSQPFIVYSARRMEQSACLCRECNASVLASLLRKNLI